MEIKDSRICIILARSGSKRIHEKNLQKIKGKTLVEHAVKCCTSNDIKTILSSDSEKILNHFKSKEVIRHKRSITNSLDSSSTEQALIEVLKYFSIPSETEVILIPPTNPLRSSVDLKYFIQQWESKARPSGYSQAFSVLSMKNDFWIKDKGEIKRVRDIVFNKIEPRVTMERENIYLETSAIYLSRANLIYNGLSLIEDHPYPIELSRFASIDIDTEVDLEIARKLFAE